MQFLTLNKSNIEIRRIYLAKEFGIILSGSKQTHHLERQLS